MLSPTTITSSLDASIPIKKNINYSLEALRGFAALLVVWHHASTIWPQETIKHLPDPVHAPTGVWSYSPPGHLSVLVFFVLSGYVIGLTTSGGLTLAGIPVYLKKRLTRIYPIYAVALAATALVAPQAYSLATWAAHLSFTQVLASPVVWENNPLWSLHYEILFYLLFIPLSYFRVRPLWSALVALFVGLGATWLHPMLPALLSSYALGFSFWLAGWAVADAVRNRPEQFDYATMVAWLLLLFAMGRFNVLTTLWTKVSSMAGLPVELPLSVSWEQRIIAVADLAFLPYALLMVIAFTGRSIPWQRLITSVLFALPAYTLVYIIRSHALADASLALPICFYLAALLMYVTGAGLQTGATRLLKPLEQAGSISYGLYIIHFSVLVAVLQAPLPSGSQATWALRAVISLAISLLLAYLLEKRFQPWVRTLFYK